MCGSSSSSSFPDVASGAAAIIVAGGTGSRMGSDRPKQYLDLLGAPVLLWSVRAFLAHPGVGRVVVVLPAADAESPPSWLAGVPVTIVAGGAERGDSVRAGLDALPAGDGTVLIHDAARPLVPGAVITRVLEAARGGGAIAAMPVVDTVKAADRRGFVSRTLDRSGLWLAQTPQGFPLERLREVHRRAAAEGVAATDDAGLFERYGLEVRVVEGAAWNVKITRADDLRAAAALAAVFGVPPSPPPPVTPELRE